MIHNSLRRFLHWLQVPTRRLCSFSSLSVCFTVFHFDRSSTLLKKKERKTGLCLAKTIAVCNLESGGFLTREGGEQSTWTWRRARQTAAMWKVSVVKAPAEDNIMFWPAWSSLYGGKTLHLGHVLTESVEKCKGGGGDICFGLTSAQNSLKSQLTRKSEQRPSE